MSKEKVIEYVMNSPYNTNRAVLEGLLDNISKEEWNTLFEEEVTTAHEEYLPEGMCMGELSYNKFINVNTIKITFDGIEYECNATEYESVFLYGATVDEEENVDFSKYPFVLSSYSQGSNGITTSVSGVHTIKVEIPKDNEDSSSDWSTAEVTFINTKPDSSYSVRIATIESSYITVKKIDVTDSDTVIVPLYKQKYLLSDIDDRDIEYAPQTTGGIEYNSSDGYLIISNGTISLQGSQQD